MKKSIFFIIALSALILSSCSDFLDVTPSGTPTADTYFQNDEQAENALKGIYEPMVDGDDLYGRDILWEQCVGTQMVPGRTRDWPELFCLKWTGDESPLRNAFEMTYKLMNRANWIVQALLEKEKETALTDVENRSLGEAYFFRAWFHYLTAYRYGCATNGVPFVYYEDFEGGFDFSIPTQQATVMEDYEMVIADLKKAEERLPSYKSYGTSDLGRACAESACAFQARVYAYWATWDSSKWSNVVETVNKLESTYSRSLNPSYSELFTDDTSKWFNDEYCYAIGCNGGYGANRAGVEFIGCVLENKGWGVYNGWGQFKPTYDAYEEFSLDGDRTVNERLARSMLEYGVEFQYNGETMRYYGAQDVETGFQINKWMDPFAHADFVDAGYVNESGGSWPTARVNFHVIRFADCMLLRAEANLHLGNTSAAASDLNKIRARVGLDQTCKGTWRELYHERYCELAYEPMMDHRGDLMRWALAGEGDLKTLAIAELENHPRSLFHVWRDDPDSPVGVGVGANGTETSPSGKVRTHYDSIDLLDGNGVGPYQDYVGLEGPWASDGHLAVFPYPSQQISKSAGALTQNPGY